MKKRKDGRYEKKVTVGSKLDGTPIRKVFYGRTQKEIDERVRQFVQQGYQTVDRSITFKEWAVKWLETYKEDTVSDRTYKTTYLSPMNTHIIPYFGSARLADIRNIDIQAFLKTKTALSQSLIDKIILSLKAIFESAVDNELLMKNPCKSLSIESSAEKISKRAYSAAEARRVIDFAKTHRYGAPIIMMLKTGLRTGELLALKWADINMRDMTVSVTKAVTQENYIYKVDKPKTETSVRVLPFDEEMKQVLDAMPRSIGFVFTNSLEVPSSPLWARTVPAVFMRDYSEYCEQRELKHSTLLPHELRHTFGSLLYEATGDIYIVSKLLGHSSVDITAKVYVHEGPTKRRDAINMLSAMV